MKNLSLALNGILAIAIIILFYLHFSSTSNNNNIEQTKNVAEEAPIIETEIDTESKINVESKVGYINIDSLQDQYKYYEVLINKLRAKEKKYDKELTSKSTVFEKKVQEFQQNAQKMGQLEGQMKQKELAQEEQELYKLRDEFTTQFQNEQVKLNDKLQKKVKTYIEEYNKNTNYDIIIGTSTLGNKVLYHKDEIDITNIVAKGLNEQYQNENKK